MKKQIEQVTEFHRIFKLPIRYLPQLIPNDEFEMRFSLIIEETNELLHAYRNNDLIEFADGLIDTLYVLIGLAVQSGFSDKLEFLFDDVHKSNMTKLDENGLPIFRNDGKILKSNLFKPPNLKTLI
jgi:predicted HAD superfamily Cof-like phosphohydrolase